MSADHSGLKERAETELKKYLIMFAYLLVIIGLFQFHEYVILRQHGLPYTRLGFGVIKALILAKVMLIGEAMKLGRRLSALPRIYLVIGRAAVFAIFFLAFELLEEALKALFTGKDVIESITAPGGSIAASAVVAMIMWVMLIPYFAFVELGRAYGIANVKQLLFTREPSETSAQRPAAAANN